MNKRKIQKDEYGLFIGYFTYVRPLYGTCFKEGETVIAEQLGDSFVPLFGVTTIGNNLKPDGFFEIWCSTSIQYHRGYKLTAEHLKDYRQNKSLALKLGYIKKLSKIFEKHNKEVAKFLKND